MSNKIKSIQAREILDSRGDPTIEVEVILENGLKAKASVPSGASTGSFEALELRDNDPKRYDGKGVLMACQNVNKKINQTLKGIDVTRQQEIDQRMIELDGTKNKSKLGANAILGVSLACCRAGAEAMNLPLYKYIQESQMSNVKCQMLPTPMFNIFNGGKHADTNLDFQEFMVVPLPLSLRGATRRSFAKQNVDGERRSNPVVNNITTGLRSLSRAKRGISPAFLLKNAGLLAMTTKQMIEMGTEIFHSLGKVLKSHGLDTDLGNEGGYAPDILSSEEAIELILEAIKKAGYQAGKDISLATDVGASTLYNKKTKKYILKADKLSLTRDQLIEFYLDWIKKYPIISIEDPLYEDDWEGWRSLMSNVKCQMSNVTIVGDDLFTTNTERLKKGIEMGAANAIIIKPNQIGTLTETIDCIKMAKEAGYKIIVSHRSGETNDSFIADLAVASGADFIKAGAPSRGERVAKYNRLMEIEDNLSLRGATLNPERSEG